MKKSEVNLSEHLKAPDFDPEQLGARFWYEQYLKQQVQIEQLEQQIKQLQETVHKLTHRDSSNSSQPPSQDGYKKAKPSQQQRKKRGPKYGHPGSSRNGFGWIDHSIELTLNECPKCGASLARDERESVERHQVAELVNKPVEVSEYSRGLYRCSACGWQGRSPLPAGCRSDFSYGALLSSLVGWLGYGGNLPWRKQRYLVESVFGIPLSQGSLAKMHQWFCGGLQPAYEQWWAWIQEPGVRCVDETSYRLNGVLHWMWVATSAQVCVLFFAPTRSTAEVKALLGEEFAGILSSDCWSAYRPQPARLKQKCLTHFERDLSALESSRFEANRAFAQGVFPVLQAARQAYGQYHQGELTLSQLQQFRPDVEARLDRVLNHPPDGGWAADAQNLANRLRRHWNEWFTFLEHPEVKPDNNDAERAVRPVVIHRKVSGGARSHWGAQVVAMMFSFLETMRLQGKNAVEELANLLSQPQRSPPQLQPHLSE
jgi:transposase